MIEQQVALFVAIMLAAAVVAIISRRLPVPYVTAMAAIGVVASPFLNGRFPPIDHALILFVFLPGLLFEAAFNLDWRELRGNLVAVVVLATIGVLVTSGLVAVVGRLALGLPLAAAVLLGAALAATDPVATVAIFRRLGVPHRLRNLVEGESLLNDGTGVVLFTVALTATQAGFSIPSAALDFLRLTVGGLALGGGLGLVLSRITGFVDDPQVEITLTALAAYGGYLAGETLHVSGILTVVAAGLVIGNYARQQRMSARTRQAVETMWDYVAFVLNAAVFVLIAGVVPIQVVLDHAAAVVGGAAALLVARAVTVYGLVNVLRPLGRPLGLRSQHLLAWGGLRGAVAIALLLSLPPDIPGFETLRAVIYGAVLSSVLVQGLLLVPLTRLLSPRLEQGGETA